MPWVRDYEQPLVIPCRRGRPGAGGVGQVSHEWTRTTAAAGGTLHAARLRATGPARSNQLPVARGPFGRIGRATEAAGDPCASLLLPATVMRRGDPCPRDDAHLLQEHEQPRAPGSQTLPSSRSPRRPGDVQVRRHRPRRGGRADQARWTVRITVILSNSDPLCRKTAAGQRRKAWRPTAASEVSARRFTMGLTYQTGYVRACISRGPLVRPRRGQGCCL